MRKELKMEEITKIFKYKVIVNVYIHTVNMTKM